MRQKNRYQIITRVTAIFLAVMVLFTLISRWIWQRGVIEVETGRPASRTITHRVEVSGRIRENRDTAVVTEPNQRVKAVYVNEGQNVKKGDLLFTVDTDLLQEQILYARQEMEKAELTSGDQASSRAAVAARRANEIAGASENYSLNVTRADTQLARAARVLAEAQRKLQDYDKAPKASGGKTSETSSTSSDSAVEAALAENVEARQQDYIDAQQALVTLQWRIEEAVSEALREAEAAQYQGSGTFYGYYGAGWRENEQEEYAEDDGEIWEQEEGAESGEWNEDGELAENEEQVQVGTSAVIEIEYHDRTRSGDWEDAPEEEELSYNIYSLEESVDDGRLPFAASDESDAAGETLLLAAGHGADAAADDGILLIEDGDPLIEDEEDDNGEIDGIRTGGAGDGGHAGAGIDLDRNSKNESGMGWMDPTGNGSGFGNTGMSADMDAADLPIMQALSDEDVRLIEQRVRSGYASQLTAAQKKVDTALAAYHAAKIVLDQYQEEQARNAGNADAQTRAELAAAVTAARDAYTDAALTDNEARVTGGRGIASASLPEARDSTGQIDAITRRQNELALDKLTALADAEGRITAPCDGCITQVAVTAGERTMDTTAIMMTDLTGGLAFTATITKDQLKYIAVGDEVTLRTGGKDKQEITLPVTMITPAQNEEGAYELVVQLPQEEAETPAASYTVLAPATFSLGAAVDMTYVSTSRNYSAVVPVSALHVDEKNQTYVLLPQEEQTIMGTAMKAVRTDVTVLEKNDQYAALEGVSISDEIIISSGKKILEAGKRVRVK